MTLISSSRLTAADLEVWERLERLDTGRSIMLGAVMRAKAHRAMTTIGEFIAGKRAYLGVSWGKDSVVVADLVLRVDPNFPLIHCRYPPLELPECDLVRNAFLCMWPRANYSETRSPCRLDEEGWHATGTMEDGFAQASARYPDGYISGVRADESKARKLRQRIHGETTKRTCAPISTWSGDDVFTYLRLRNLPVHPVYAMSFGGMIPRERLRVAHLTLKHAEEFDRRGWERAYYRDVLEQIDRLAKTQLAQRKSNS